jgi:CubicO group peptidase (beta-lactamase class C family)
MKLIFAIFCVFSVTACQVSVVDAKNKTVTPQELGFSDARLQRIAPVMQAYIDQGKLAGTLIMVARNGQIAYINAQGMMDKEAKKPMREDTIFRIYSMTKPITAVAAMTLWEQGKFHMNDPISKYLPEFEKMKVYVSGAGEEMIVEDANQPIRVIDLFTHTAGFSYGFTGSEVDNLYRKLLQKPDELKRSNILSKVADLPLSHQPGTAWQYGVSTDILGFLVEKISGKKLGDYLQETVFGPLEMQDTGFFVPADKVDRFAQIYTANKQGQTVVMKNEPLGDFLSDPDIHNAGGGMVSTLHDYFTFAQMLLNGGEINGTRILGRKTVEYLTSNHLPENLIPFEAKSPGEGFAMAMSVTVDPNMSLFMNSKGTYGWAGLASTHFRIDPEEKLIVIAMAQFMPTAFHRYNEDLRNLVYQALND